MELSNYTNKADLEGGIHTSTLALKTDMTNCESIVDDLDVNKPKFDLRKPSNEVDNVAVKKLVLIN